MPPFEGIICVVRPERPEDVEEIGYLAANPDVVEMSMAARDQFIQFGQSEGRVQWVNHELIAAARDRKISELHFKREPVITRAPGSAIDFLSEEVKVLFDIPEKPPVSASAYGQILIDELRKNPERKYLDLGAGLRQIYFSNVVNMEIYPSYSTDVISIGEDLPFENEQFDEILAFAVLEHTRRPWEVANEMTRVLKPGGKIWVDYPFLQSVHGYPHHYFNATPQGNKSLFEENFNIESLLVTQNQHPIYTLWWFLQIWKSGLPPTAVVDFSNLTIDQILRQPPEFHLAKNYSELLPQSIQ